MEDLWLPALVSNNHRAIVSLDAPMLVLRKDIYSNEGLNFPANISQMMQHAAFLKGKHGTTMGIDVPLYLGEDYLHTWATLLYRRGGSVWNENTYNVSGYVNSPQSLLALQDIVTIRQSSKYQQSK